MSNFDNAISYLKIFCESMVLRPYEALQLILLLDRVVLNIVLIIVSHVIVAIEI